MYFVMKIAHNLLIYNQQYKMLNRVLFNVKKMSFTNCNYNKILSRNTVKKTATNFMVLI